jgi:hypothetical protein
MIYEIYDALKSAGAPDNKAKEAARAVAELQQTDRFTRIESDIRLIKWMLGVLITMNIGIILMLHKTL